MENEQVKDREDRASAPTTALTTQASPDQMAANMARMKAMIDLKKQFLKENLIEGIERDYAVIPGTNKLSLLKPGAEKLLDWHGYVGCFIMTAEKEDWSIGLFAYTYRCQIRQKGTNIVVAECDGDASSYESRYRFEWKRDYEIPKGIDLETLVSKEFTYGKNKTVKYQMIVANPADKRNTVRKIAQKRAFIGATVLATATSDLFAADVEPDDDQEGNGHKSTGEGKPKGDYGNAISEAQVRRFFGLMKNTTIDKTQLLAYIKAKYGIDSLEEVGYKIYEPICKAIESGKLEMPASKPTSETAKPEASQQAPASSVPASGGKITVPQIKDLNMLLNSLGKTEPEFKDWLQHAFPQYAGKGVNDLLSSEVDAVKFAFQQYCEGEAQ